jgi:NAD(P)H-dependent FMN reductase
VPDDPRLSIPVLLCTIRAGRRSAHVARLLLGQLEGRDEVGTALIALVDLDLPVMRHRLGQTDAAPPGTVGLSEKLSRADGLVIVAPKYKNGYPGSLKNAFDYLPAARPCGASPSAASRCHRAVSVASVASPRGGWFSWPWGCPDPGCAPHLPGR